MRERLAAIWRRAEGWLRREAYIRELVRTVAQRAYQDGHNAAMANHYQALENARCAAQAYGELIGRQTLAHELQVAHGVDEGGERAMSPDEIATLKVRQLH